MGYAFISYCRADLAYVRDLVAFLWGNGIEVWLDLQTPTGERWKRLVCRKIDECSAFVLVMSSAAHESAWVEEEHHRAGLKDKPILPLLLEGIPFFGTYGTQYEDVRGGTMPGAECLATLRGHTGPCDNPAPAPPTVIPAQLSGARVGDGWRPWRDALSDPWAFVAAACAGLALDGVIWAADRGVRAAATVAVIGAVLAFSAYVLAGALTRR
jgi:TIR domain